MNVVYSQLAHIAQNDSALSYGCFWHTLHPAWCVCRQQDFYRILTGEQSEEERVACLHGLSVAKLGRISTSYHDRCTNCEFRMCAEPENNMIKQQRALLSTEGVDLRFTDDAVMVRMLSAEPFAVRHLLCALPSFLYDQHLATGDDSALRAIVMRSGNAGISAACVTSAAEAMTSTLQHSMQRRGWSSPLRSKS